MKLTITTHARWNRHIVLRSMMWSLLLLVFIVQIKAQGISVSGVVKGDENDVLPGATVLEKGTTNGTITDLNGEFSLNISSSDGFLMVSFVGFESKEVPINGREKIEIQLTPDIESLEEVVVVGYGTQKKSDVTGSVSSINAEMLERQGPKVNVMETLQGAVPGLRLQQTSNTAQGSSYEIQIRGRNSITAGNGPLIIVDGIPFESGALNEINQADVKSVEVLKDASASAIYGARGANGVILITTKKGKIGKPKIQYTGSYGIRQISNKPDLMNGPENYEYSVTRFGESAIDATRQENYDNGVSTDWIDEVSRTGQEQRHTLSVSGASENFNYYISSGYTDVKGIVKGDNFEQISLRTNLAMNVTNWLEIGTSTQLALKDFSGVTANMGLAYEMNPLISPYDESGNLVIQPWPENPQYTNPLMNLNIQDENKRQRIFSSNYARVDFPFIEGLSYKVKLGYTLENSQQGQYYDKENTVQGQQNNGLANTWDRQKTDLLFENLLLYNREFGRHKIGVTGLYSTQQFIQEERRLESSQFPTDVLTWYQSDIALVVNPSSGFIQQTYRSYMGRLNYSFDERYSLTATVRKDGYSGFGANSKYGTFPSIAVAWNIHNETFFPQSDFLSNLKFRMSYGKNGNQAVNAYQSLANLTVLNYLGGSNGNETAAGFFPNNLGNPGLGWETSTSLNYAIEFGLIEGRIQGNLDVYNTRTVDLLLDRAISSVQGADNILQNIGETQNTGFDLALTSFNIDNEKISWKTTFTMSYNKNEIIDLYGDGEDDPANGWFIGEPITANYSYLIDGVWQETDDISGSHMPDAVPGDVKLKDVDGDGALTPDDRTIIGQTDPRYIYGLVNSLEFKGFTVSFNAFAYQGRMRQNVFWDPDFTLVGGLRNVINHNFWTPESPTNEYPENRDGTNPLDVQYYKDADFIRLSDLSIGYNFSNALISKIGFSSLKVFANARNLFTITKWNGTDPLLNDQKSIPQDRAFIFGLSLNL